MHTFYYPNHTIHDPGTLPQPGKPRQAAFYAEVAQRGVVIQEAVQAASLGEISPPSDFGLGPIAEVHQHDLIAFLQTAHERLLSAARVDVAIPTTFSLGVRPPHKPLSIWGLLGYYCFDVTSPIFKDTWEAAYWSAQTAVNAADWVRNSEEQLAYALCRPPGHHASRDTYGGFCYLNNAAIAAQWLVSEGQRVAVLDIDYHHGNGTQAIFYGRADVLTCSVHVDPLHDYPFYWGFADEYGTGAGNNLNFNYPLPIGTQEAAYLKALDEALRKIQAFVPDSLVVCFGADTLKNDPLGKFNLSVESYGRVGAKIASLNLPTIIIQEGGYLLSHLGESVVSFLQGIEKGK